MKPIVSFGLRKITTKQFAVIEGVLQEGKPIELGTHIGFGINDVHRMIACFTKFELQSASSTFIIIEVICEFEIEASDWESLKDEKQENVVLPKELLSHLAVLNVGTTRGVLHAKTEGTQYNSYFLPTVNITEFVKDDILFPIN